MKLFNQAQMDEINKVAEKSLATLEPQKAIKTSSIQDDLKAMSDNVIAYFKDSPAILIKSEKEFSDYIDACIEYGYAGIDTETTGLDRVKDYVVGMSLYVPGRPECYIPFKHKVPIFDSPYKDQLTYEQVNTHLQRLVDSNHCRLIFANADFDLSMIYKDIKVDLNSAFYYDVILAWRCLKEDERDNSLKALYNKYVLKGKGDPKKFNDFFSPQLFPYSKPEVAKLYAANDAKITFDLFRWQLPYITKTDPKCQKNHLEAIADLIWNVEMPLVTICQNMHRTGIYVDKEVASALQKRYKTREAQELEVLSGMVDELISQSDYSLSKKRPFASGKDFNPTSTMHVKYLVYDMLQIIPGKGGQTTDKSFLADLNIPVTNQILKVRSLRTLIGTFVDKLPKATTPDSRIHAQFRQIGAATGRMSSAEPNMQNIPSHALDIRHLFRATPGYVMLSSDYSAQEPRLTAFVSKDPKMIQSFKDDRDIYASIASVAFGVPYENCLEFNPITGENQPDGKERRGQAKFIVLGITYGRSVPSISDQLYGKRDDMEEEQKIKEAQKVYDAVLNSFPNLRALMIKAQNDAKTKGYVETILGRRRHIPDMQLPEFEFRPKPGYVNPDIDPLDPNTLKDKSAIPPRIVKQLEGEFASYKYFGQIARRIRELDEQHIKVINNRKKIGDASRLTVNCVDFKTEILTKRGWKQYDQVSVGDSILSYDLASQEITDDEILDIIIDEREQSAIQFKNMTFDAVSTLNHRWVVGSSKELPKIRTTHDIMNHKWPDFPIIRVADNTFSDNVDISDDLLKLIGWIMTDGCIDKKHYGIELYQSTRKPKNQEVYHDMVSTLDRLQLSYRNDCKDGVYHILYLHKCDITIWLHDKFINRTLDFDFISSLSQRQCLVLMKSMLQGDGSGVNGDGSFTDSSVVYTCNSKEKRDVFQYLAFRAGHATHASTITPEDVSDYPSKRKEYDSIVGDTPITKKEYYNVVVLKWKRSHIYDYAKSEVIVPGVWCVSTRNGTWVARRNGQVYITGNSIIQGSAADQTKLAVLMLENNPEWKKLGGRLLVPVHDELIAEVPLEHWKEGGELLSSMMCEAANFLPFPSKCDVTTTLRWYGLEYPCPYDRPESLENLTESNIKWLQYHVKELEYELPILPNDDGSRLMGNAALGINGKLTDELKNIIEDYRHRYNLTSDIDFINHINNKVIKGE